MTRTGIIATMRPLTYRSIAEASAPTTSAWCWHDETVLRYRPRPRSSNPPPRLSGDFKGGVRSFSPSREAFQREVTPFDPRRDLFLFQRGIHRELTPFHPPRGNVIASCAG